MPNITPIQDDFSGGEISPRMQGKVSSREYQTGLALCENFEVTPQGSLEYRSGTEYVLTASENTQLIKTFIRNVGEDLILELNTDTLRIIDNTGNIISYLSPDPLVDPTFDQGFRYWTIAKFNEPTDPLYSSVFKPIFGAGVKATLWNDPDRPDNVPIPPADLTECSVAQKFVKTGNDGSLYNLSYEITLDFEDNNFDVAKGEYVVRVTDSDGEAYLFSRIVPIPNQRPPFADGGKVSFFDTAQFPLKNGDVTIQFLFINYDDPNATNVWKFIEFELTDIKLTEILPDRLNASFNIPSNWVNSDNELKNIQTCQDSGEGIMFFTVEGGDIYFLSNPDLDDQWEFSPFDPALNLEREFTDNVPVACTIHQGRLWLGGGDKKPNALYASETFNYFNFEIPDVPLDSSPLNFRLSTNGSIKWLEGLKNLLIGTDRGELIGRSSGSAITTTDFNFSLEQTWGCAPIQPLEVGNKVFYVTGGKTRLRALYDQGDNTNGYGSADITFPIQSTFNLEIIDLAFQKNPDYLVYLLLSDGTMLVSTYFEAGQVNAWARYVTEGKILSITTTNGAEGTYLNMLVERQVSNGFERYIERKPPIAFLGGNLDSYTKTIIPADRRVTDIARLYSQAAAAIVLCDEGYQLFDDISLENGVDNEWEFPEYIPIGSTVYIGIKYVGVVKTLPVEGSSRIGTAQVQKRRFNEIFLRLFDSGIPKVNGDYPSIRVPENAMNTSQTLFTGDSSVHDSGYLDGSIEITQDLSLPLNISAIFGKLKGSAI